MLKELYKNKKSMAKIYVVIVSILAILIVAGLVMDATHTSEEDLKQEW